MDQNISLKLDVYKLKLDLDKLQKLLPEIIRISCVDLKIKCTFVHILDIFLFSFLPFDSGGLNYRKISNNKL